MKRSEVRAIFPDATDEQVSKMLTAVHSETDDLRDDLDKARADLDKAQKNTDPEGWKDKYNTLKQEHDDYKAEQEKKQTEEAKKAALKDLVKDTFSEKGLEKVLKYTDLDSIELTKDGKVKGASDVLKSVSDEWADFVVNTNTQGADTHGNSGASGSGGGGSTTMTRADIMKISDPIARQEAIMKNPGAFV